jgi:hypothetical protein
VADIDSGSFAKINKIKARLRTAAIVGIVATVISAITPTTKGFITIYGGSKLIEAVNSPKAAKIGSKTLSVVEKWLDEHSKP